LTVSFWAENERIFWGCRIVVMWKFGSIPEKIKKKNVTNCLLFLKVVYNYRHHPIIHNHSLVKIALDALSIGKK
jgi:hypothetical protein